MVAACLKLSNEKPSVPIDCCGIRFDKLFIRTGDIERLEFQLAWQTRDQMDQCKVHHNISFIPSAYIDTDLPHAERLFKFREDTFSLHYEFAGTCGPVTLSASMKDNEQLDLDIFVVINEQ